jgi:methylglutaconyl-CoA hydratase
MGSVRIERRADGCAILVLDNERRKNALDLAMLAGLQTALTELAQDATCRVVVLRGRGENFCAGRDISELGASDEASSDGALRSDFERLRALANTLYNFPKPTLAAVRGYALGLGTALVALCDLVVAEESARLGIPEAKVGVPPSLTTVALMQVVPLKAATRILFTGGLIEARQAAQIGLINETVPDGGLDAALDRLVQELLEVSPTAVRLCKELMRATAGKDFAASVDVALQTAMRGLNTSDAVEGRRAFLEKRRPAWGSLKPS